MQGEGGLERVIVKKKKNESISRVICPMKEISVSREVAILNSIIFGRTDSGFAGKKSNRKLLVSQFIQSLCTYKFHLDFQLLLLEGY